MRGISLDREVPRIIAGSAFERRDWELAGGKHSVMDTILRGITVWLDRIDRVITGVTGGLLGFLTLLVAVQVVGRYAFQTGLFWADELTGVIMMWAAMLGAAGCIWTDSHIRLTMVIERLPPSVRTWLLVLMDGVILWFAAVLFVEGAKLVQSTMGGSLSSLDIPIGMTYVVLPGTAVFMVVFSLMAALNRLARHYRGKGGES
jgi:TRAP-type C4-dicarboxylate transport system permease small subunit